MYEHSNPIDFLIDFAWANGADKFTVQNAKDELKRLRANTESNYENVAWVRVNNRGDLYDPRLHFNPFYEEHIVPLYANKEELKKFLDKRR